MKPTRYTRVVAEQLVAADHLRLVADRVTPSILEAIHWATVHGEQTYEAVVTPEIVAAVRNDPAMAALSAEMRAAANVTTAVYDGDLPVRVFIADATVGIGLTDDHGVLRALILTDNDAVSTWAVETFEGYRADARPIGADAATPSPPNTT